MHRNMVPPSSGWTKLSVRNQKSWICLMSPYRVDEKGKTVWFLVRVEICLFSTTFKQSDSPPSLTNCYMTFFLMSWSGLRHKLSIHLHLVQINNDIPPLAQICMAWHLIKQKNFLSFTYNCIHLSWQDMFSGLLPVFWNLASDYLEHEIHALKRSLNNITNTNITPLNGLLSKHFTQKGYSCLVHKNQQQSLQSVKFILLLMDY